MDISADSGTGTSGTVDIPNLDLSRGLTQLPSNFVDATKLVDRRCTPNDPFRNSSFTITGRGGIPQNPTEMLDADAIISNWVTLDSEEENSDEADIDVHLITTPHQRIIEAQGIVTTPDGQIFLSAEVPTVTPQGEWIPGLDCSQLQKVMESGS